MNIKNFRAGNDIITGIENICGFSFTFALTRGKSALLGVKRILLLLRKNVYLLPVVYV